MRNKINLIICIIFVNLFLISFVSSTSIELSQTQNTGELRIIKTGAETLYDVNYNLTSVTEDKDPFWEDFLELFGIGTDEKETLTYANISICSDIESKEIEDDLLKLSTIYEIPARLPKKDKEGKEISNLTRELIKFDEKSKTPETFEVGDRYCFYDTVLLTDDFYYKYGENSIIIIPEVEVISQTYLNQTKAQTGSLIHLEVNDPTLKAYYSFDDPSKYKRGGIGTGFDFDGTNGEYLQKDTFRPNTNETLTVCGWSKLNDNTQQLRPDIVGTYYTNRGMKLRMNSDNTYSFLVYSINGVDTSGLAISNRTFYVNDSRTYVCGVYDGNRAYIYVNGVDYSTVDGSEVVDGDIRWDGRALAVGIGDGGYELNSTVDEIIIINETYSQQDILDLYQNVSIGLRPYANDPNLLVDYRFDYNIEDSSLYGNDLYEVGISLNPFDLTNNDNSDGVITGGVYRVASPYYNGYEFDGVSDYITIPYDESFDFTNDFTIMSWIKLNGGQQAYSTVIGKEKTGSNGYSLNVHSDEKLQGWMGNGTAGGWSTAYGTTVLNSGQWYHVAFRYDSTSQTVALFLDGNQDGANATAPIPPNSTYGGPLIIGSSAVFPTTREFKGTIDEVKLYNRSLTNAEILAVVNNESSVFFNSGEQTLPSFNITSVTNGANMSVSFKNNENTNVSGKYGYWKYEDGYDNTDPNLIMFFPLDSDLKDYSGNGYNLTLTGSMNYEQSIFENGSIFDTTNYASVTLPSEMTTMSNFSNCQWLKFYNTSEDYQYINYPAEGYAIRVSNNGQLTILLNTTLNGWNIVHANVGYIPFGEWKHICYTYSSNNSNVYVDGINVASSSVYGGDIGIVATNFYLSRNSDTNRLNGTLDDVKIWNKTLTTNEVLKDYTKGLSQWSYTDSINLTFGVTQEFEIPSTSTNVLPIISYYSDMHNFSTPYVYDSVILDYYTLTIDLTAPDVTSLTETPSDPATYSVSGLGNYEFNATVTNGVGVETVILEFNGTNYTADNSIGDVYNVTLPINLGVGNYSYFWYANDSLNNVNNTETGTYNVTHSGTDCQVLFNTTSPRVYPEAFLVYTDCDSEFTLTRNGTVVANNSEQSLGVGTYNFTVIRTDNQNYTNIVDEEYFEITQASQIAILSFNETSPINYGTYLNISCNGELYQDNVNITDEIGTSYLLGVGSYDFSCQLYESQNYSYDDDNSTFVVNGISQSITSLLNGVNDNLSIIYPQQINASFTGTNQTTLTIKLNDTEIVIGDNYTIGVGYWTLNYSAPSNQNYSAFEEILYLEINKTTTITTITTDPLSPIVYGTESNFSCSNDGGLETKLYVDEIDKTSENGLYVTRPARPSGYNVTCISIENQNYSSSSDETTYIIIKANSSTSLEFDPASPQVYGINVNATCSLNVGQGIAYLSRNGINVDAEENGINVILPAGNNNYSCSYSSTANYTGSTNTSIYVITQATPDINLTLDGVDSNITIDQGQSINISAIIKTGDADNPLIIYIDGEIINNGTDPISNITEFINSGEYNITSIYGESQNYTEISQSWYVTVIEYIVSIFSPQAITYNNESISFNVSSNLNSTWCGLSINEGANVTMTSFNTTYFNYTNSSMPQGLYTALVTCNNSYNIYASDSVSFAVDLMPPSITLYYPQTTTYFDYTNGIIFNYSSTDVSGIDSCDFYLDGTLNDTNTYIVNDEVYNFTKNIAEGNHSWNVECNDTNGDRDFSLQGNQSFVIDLTSPLIDYTDNTLTDYSNISYTNIYVEVNITETNFANVTYILYKDGIFENKTTYTSNIIEINWTGLDDGLYTFNVSVTDKVSLFATTNTRTVRIDTTAPIFTNLINKSTSANASFSYDVNAIDTGVGVGSFLLNDTDVFDINPNTGLITNGITLDTLQIYWLEITVLDKIGNSDTGVFYINITEAIIPTPPSNVTSSKCRYRYFGYWDNDLPFFRESGCI